MTSPPFHRRHRGPILAALFVTATALLFLARPVWRALRLPTLPVTTGVIIEFRHPAATSTARLRLVDAPGPVRVLEVETGTERVLDGGHLVIEVEGAPRNFNIEVPRAMPSMELHVSDRTVFQRKGTIVTTIWPIDRDSTWLVPLTP